MGRENESIRQGKSRALSHLMWKRSTCGKMLTDLWVHAGGERVRYRVGLCEISVRVSIENLVFQLSWNVMLLFTRLIRRGATRFVECVEISMQNLPMTSQHNKGLWCLAQQTLETHGRYEEINVAAYALVYFGSFNDVWPVIIISPPIPIVGVFSLCAGAMHGRKGWFLNFQDPSRSGSKTVLGY